MANDDSIVVGYLSLKLKMKGLNPITGSDRVKMTKKFFFSFLMFKGIFTSAKLAVFVRQKFY
jgi:hypothetical protein